jgi:hypothetical protein
MYVSSTEVRNKTLRTSTNHPSRVLGLRLGLPDTRRRQRHDAPAHNALHQLDYRLCRSANEVYRATLALEKEVECNVLRGWALIGAPGCLVTAESPQRDLQVVAVRAQLRSPLGSTIYLRQCLSIRSLLCKRTEFRNALLVVIISFHEW